mmetsp:Transcript_71556/g.113877  ORF Transcript_71556/g.113877 Transcript_71556/m.113877 type:complete len:279 (+) Transcript_71556:1098-1934(+)
MSDTAQEIRHIGHIHVGHIHQRRDARRRRLIVYVAETRNGASADIGHSHRTSKQKRRARHVGSSLTLRAGEAGLHRRVQLLLLLQLLLCQLFVLFLLQILHPLRRMFFVEVLPVFVELLQLFVVAFLAIFDFLQIRSIRRTTMWFELRRKIWDRSIGNESLLGTPMDFVLAVASFAAAAYLDGVLVASSSFVSSRFVMVEALQNGRLFVIVVSISCSSCCSGIMTFERAGIDDERRILIWLWSAWLELARCLLVSRSGMLRGMLRFGGHGESRVIFSL